MPANSFLQEARAASALNHPNIVTIHEILETDSGDLLMVQEFVPGRTLRDFVDCARCRLTGRMDIARQLARALGAAHRAGVVHRDIKPENVMVRPDGYVKVLDFGLAHRTLTDSLDTVDDRRVLQKITTEGPIIGTLAYMSPEQARRAAGRQRHGRVLPRHRLLRDADRPPPVRGERRLLGAARDSQRASRAAVAPQPRGAARPRCARARDARQGALGASDDEGIEAELNTASGTSGFATPAPAVARALVGRDRERAAWPRSCRRSRPGAA